MERKAKAAAETSVYLVVVAAILVVANIIAYVAIHKRIDVTRNERFTLSQGSGPQGRRVRRGERDRRRPGFDRPGLHGSRLQVRKREGSHPDHPARPCR